MKLKKSLSIILIGLLVLPAFGCGGNSSETSRSDSSDESSVSATDSDSESVVIPTTETMFIQNGVSDYTVVYASDMTAAEETAVSELRILLYEATGIDFPTHALSQGEFSSFPEEEKYLSVGDNALTEAAGIGYDETLLGDSGAHLETKGNSVFMCGGSPYGVLYAVYDFLELQLGYDYYGKNCVGFDEASCLESRLIDVNKDDIPSFEYRYAFYGTTYTDSTCRRRLRQQATSEIYYSDGTIPAFHNAIELSNGAYTSSNCNQVCYTRDPEGLAQTVFENIVSHFIEVDDTKHIVTFTQEDNFDWCTCSSCQAFIKAHGGCNSATQIPVCNLIQKKLNAYMEEKYPGRTPVSLVFFAYIPTKDAPAVAEADGSYTPYEDLKFEENLGVDVAMMGMDFRSDITANTSYFENLKKWGCYTDNLHYWTYGCNFSNFFEPYNYLSVIGSSYKEYVKYGSTYIMNQSDYTNDYAPDWANLKMYIESKLMWNVDTDIRVYYDKFFENFYGPAAETMREYYEAYILYDKVNGRNFTEGILNGYLAYIERAYDDILALKYSDPQRYSLICDRINVESLTPRMYLLELKGYVWDWSYTREFIADLQADTRALGVSYYGEFTTMDSYWTQWI